MLILGLNAFHADAAACLVADGKLIAAAEEERFRRVKHWAGFPSEAVKWCLKEAGAALEDITDLAVNQDSGANNWRRAEFLVRQWPGMATVLDRPIPIDLQRTMITHLPFAPEVVELETGHIPAVVDPAGFAGLLRQPRRSSYSA